MVVDPQRDSRRGNVLRIVGIVLTVGGALLLIGGIFGIVPNALSPDAFDFFWMPFVGSFALAGGIISWVAGNLLRGSARFARGSIGSFPTVTPPAVAGAPGWDCANCGNRNQPAATACSVCGTARA